MKVERLGWTLSLFCALGFLGGCSDGPNTQYLPIGSTCGSAAACGTSPFDCDEGQPGGYCTRPCVGDGDCPGDSVCLRSICRRKCGSDDNCRASEGYHCVNAGATSTLCLIPEGAP
jgi:hypothetical protein